MNSVKLIQWLLLCSALTGLQTQAQHSDPTAPFQALPSASVDAVGAWTLESILISESRRVAVINGQRYTENDTVAGARILSIQPGVVRLRHRGEEMTLSMHRSIRTQNKVSSTHD